MKQLFTIIILLLTLNTFARSNNHNNKDTLLLDFVSIFETVRINQGNNIKDENSTFYVVLVSSTLKLNQQMEIKQ